MFFGIAFLNGHWLFWQKSGRIKRKKQQEEKQNERSNGKYTDKKKCPGIS